MITGFNTDVEFGGVTYHIQTEDKGLAKPVILSLVYDGGMILASKRLPYDDLLSGDFDESLLAERLQKQHRLICAAIQAGRIDELKRMAQAGNGANADVLETIAEPISNSDLPNFAAIPMPESVDQDAPIPKPGFDAAPLEKIDLGSLEPLVEVVGIIDDPVIFPDEAVEIVSDMTGRERPSNDRLSIEMLDNARFKGGERRTVGFMVCRGSKQKVVGDAQIMVKILGSSFRPQIFHSTTDTNGIARINIQFPNFNTGRAAFLVRASNNGEEIEIRRPITRG